MTYATELLLKVHRPKACPQYHTVAREPDDIGRPAYVWCSECPVRMACKMELLAYEASERGELV